VAEGAVGVPITVNRPTAETMPPASVFPEQSAPQSNALEQANAVVATKVAEPAATPVNTSPVLHEAAPAAVTEPTPASTPGPLQAKDLLSSPAEQATANATRTVSPDQRAGSVADYQANAETLATQQANTIAEQLIPLEPNPAKPLDAVLNFINSRTKPWTDEFGKQHTVRRYDATASADGTVINIYAWNPITNNRLGNEPLSGDLFSQEMKQFGDDAELAHRVAALQESMHPANNESQAPTPEITAPESRPIERSVDARVLSGETRSSWSKLKEWFKGASKQTEDKGKAVVNASVGANTSLGFATLETVQAALESQKAQSANVWKESEELAIKRDEALRAELAEIGIMIADKKPLIEVIADKTDRGQKAASWWAKFFGKGETPKTRQVA